MKKYFFLFSIFIFCFSFACTGGKKPLPARPSPVQDLEAKFNKMDKGGIYFYFIELSWKFESSIPLYEIQRTDGFSSKKLEDKTEKNFYLDYDVYADVVYTYYVFAVGNDGQKSDSTWIKVKTSSSVNKNGEYVFKVLEK